MRPFLQVLNDFTQAEQHRHGAELLETGNYIFMPPKMGFFARIFVSIRMDFPLSGENVMDENGENHAVDAMTLPKTGSVSRFLLTRR